MMACGIDSGSRATKVVLLDEAGEVRASCTLPTSSPPEKAAEEGLSLALERAGASRADIGAVTTTGYGRKSVPADRRLTEITCHVRGALHTTGDVRTVIDIGAQDSKVISVGPQGEVEDFVMNDRCAAGTGRFLEVISGILGTDVAGLSEIALASNDPAPISAVCVVFTESEVVSLVAQGYRAADIAAGVLRAMALRMHAFMGRIVTREPAVFVGGPARNAALTAALGDRTGLVLRVPPEPQLNGALGAALFSLENMCTGDYTRG